MACAHCGCGGAGAVCDACAPEVRLWETVAERLSREGAWRDADRVASSGPMSTSLATLRHLFGAECTGFKRGEEVARGMRKRIEGIATAVEMHGGRGSELHDVVRSAAAAMGGTAADRAGRTEAEWEAVRRVLAVSLPRVDWDVGAGMGEKATEAAMRVLTDEVAEEGGPPAAPPRGSGSVEPNSRYSF